MSLATYALLFLTALTGGFVDSIAGGGGLIVLPALLSCGIPPHLALGTNKLQASFGSFTAAMRFRGKGLIRFSDWKSGIFFTFTGAALGTLIIQRISGQSIRLFIPLLLVVIFVYFLFSPRIGRETRTARMSKAVFSVLFGFGLGFYDGFFGPGAGSFWTAGFVAVLGFELRSATAGTKLMNFTSNIASLLFFILGGNVILLLGLLMGTGQIAGAWLGSHIVMKKDIKYIRIIFLIVVGATILRLLYLRLH